MATKWAGNAPQGKWRAVFTLNIFTPASTLSQPCPCPGGIGMIKVADNRLGEWFTEYSHAMLPPLLPYHGQLFNVAERFIANLVSSHIALSFGRWQLECVPGSAREVSKRKTKTSFEQRFYWDWDNEPDNLCPRLTSINRFIISPILKAIADGPMKDQADR